MTVRLLKTFGGLSLVESDGSSALPEAAQRRLVLLALVVEAGDRGLPRDRAIAFLWPEVDDEHARRSLNQLRYTLRRELGADPLVGTLTLRPDSAVLSSDLERFRAAVAAGQVDTALSLHAAPFLDGVALGGSPELDEWADACRMETRRALTKLVEHAARDAHARGDTSRAELLWRRLVQLEPLAAPPAVGLMETLAASGNATGALVVAAEHEATVQRELGVAPDASVRAAASRVRARTAGGVTRPTPISSVPPALPAIPGLPAPGAPAHPPARLPARRVAITAALIAALVLVAFAARRNTRLPVPATATVAVLPFEVRGDAGYQYLGEGMVTLLSAKLDGAAVLRPTDARAVVSLARRQDGASSDPETAADIARQLGAGSFVLGDVVGAGGRLRLQAAAYRVGSALPVVRAGVEGEPSALFALVDSLAGILLEGLSDGAHPGNTRLAAGATSSLPALKAYLEGEQLFRTGQALAAFDAFGRAAALDSTFALASYWTSVAGWWADESDVLVHADRALRHADRVPERDRRLLVAWDSLLHGDTYEAERIYRAVIGVEPDNVAAWSQLGEVLFHYSPRRGAPLRNARPAFEKVIAFEPGQPSALIHLARIAAVDSQYARLDSIAEFFDRTDTVGEWRQEIQSLRSAARHDTAGLDRAAAILANAPDGRIWNQALFAWRVTLDPDVPRRLLAPLTSDARAPEVRAFGHVSLAYLALAAGRLDQVEAEFDRAAALDSVSAREHRALVLLLPFTNASEAQLVQMRDALVAWDVDRAPLFAASHSGGVHGDAHAVIRDYLVGGLSARLGDSAQAERRAARLERVRAAPDVQRYALAAAASVRAQVAIASGRLADAVTILENSLESETRITRAGASAFYIRSLERYLLAESLLGLGRGTKAAPWYRSFYDALFDAPFVAPAQNRLSELTTRP